MNMRYKIKFWGWQFIIFIAFTIFALGIVLFTEHGYMPDSYIGIGNIKFQLDYRFYSWGIFPALFVIAINTVYHFFIKRINYKYIRNYQSAQSILIEGLKYLIMLCIIMVLIISWIGTGFIAHPINLLITTMIVTLSVYSLLKKEHWIFWVCTILIFTAVGLYFIFNNELPGETTWSKRTDQSMFQDNGFTIIVSFGGELSSTKLSNTPVLYLFVFFLLLN